MTHTAEESSANDIGSSSDLDSDTAQTATSDTKVLAQVQILLATSVVMIRRGKDSIHGSYQCPVVRECCAPFIEDTTLVTSVMVALFGVKKSTLRKDAVQRHSKSAMHTEAVTQDAS